MNFYSHKMTTFASKVDFGLTNLTVCFVVDEQLQWASKSPDLNLNVMMWLDLKIQLCRANA